MLVISMLPFKPNCECKEPLKSQCDTIHWDVAENLAAYFVTFNADLFIQLLVAKAAFTQAVPSIGMIAHILENAIICCHCSIN
jgi:hypothetical protein